MADGDRKPQTPVDSVGPNPDRSMRTELVPKSSRDSTPRRAQRAYASTATSPPRRPRPRLGCKALLGDAKISQTTLLPYPYLVIFQVVVHLLQNSDLTLEDETPRIEVIDCENLRDDIIVGLTGPNRLKPTLRIVASEHLDLP
jgi:hypothetical protein